MTGNMKKEFPILEFDPDRNAIIEPSGHIDQIDIAEHCVICFFWEVIEKVVKEKKARVVSERKWESGAKRIWEIEYNNCRVAFFHPDVGAPPAAGMLEQAVAMGCRKFIACGGCGVLDGKLKVGEIVVPVTAIRDEGTSYHYLPPGREVSATPEAVAAVEKVLKAHKLPYRLSKTWTTDSPYRETKAKVQLRKSEGCLTVEMEAAAFFAVAQFRNVSFAQMLYSGDDVSSDEWDEREWQTHQPIREQLFWLAVEAVLET